MTYHDNPKTRMRYTMVNDRQHVMYFAEQMAAKMHVSTANGRGGWLQCPLLDLKRMLIEHVAKGDVVDIANFCMMLYERGQFNINDIRE